mmetsp:Transcript_23898/g.48381  ORF Transcript_23898/g.48381 Transcript_23898/m.48381 type:complete len:240 (+) Transcript_23898:1111-1830(+)
MLALVSPSGSPPGISFTSTSMELALSSFRTSSISESSVCSPSCVSESLMPGINLCPVSFFTEVIFSCPREVLGCSPSRESRCWSFLWFGRCLLRLRCLSSCAGDFLLFASKSSFLAPRSMRNLLGRKRRQRPVGVTAAVFPSGRHPPSLSTKMSSFGCLLAFCTVPGRRWIPRLLHLSRAFGLGPIGSEGVLVIPLLSDSPPPFPDATTRKGTRPRVAARLASGLPSSITGVVVVSRAA